MKNDSTYSIAKDGKGLFTDLIDEGYSTDRPRPSDMCATQPRPIAVFPPDIISNTPVEMLLDLRVADAFDVRLSRAVFSWQAFGGIVNDASVGGIESIVALRSFGGRFPEILTRRSGEPDQQSLVGERERWESALREPAETIAPTID